MNFIVCSYVVLVHHCPRLGAGVGAGKHVEPRHILNVPVQSLEPLIQWLSFVTVYHICLLFVVLYINQAFRFSFELFNICHLGTFYSLLCGIVFAYCLRPYGDL